MLPTPLVDSADLPTARQLPPLVPISSYRRSTNPDLAMMTSTTEHSRLPGRDAQLSDQPRMHTADSIAMAPIPQSRDNAALVSSCHTPSTTSPAKARYPSTQLQEAIKNLVPVTPQPGDGSRSQTPSAVKTCSPCKRMFYTLESYQQHMASHSTDRPFPCPLCDKAFNSRANLHRHRSVHSDERRHKCVVCGKGFNDPANLSRHARIHKPSNKFACDECPRQFNELANLVRHKRTHSGEKPYVCDVCGRAFGDGQAMASHRRLHTGEMPYKCTLCGKRCRDRSNLITHMAVHKRAEAHPCPDCNLTFISAKKLLAHTQAGACCPDNSVLHCLKKPHPLLIDPTGQSQCVPFLSPVVDCLEENTFTVSMQPQIDYSPGHIMSQSSSTLSVTWSSGVCVTSALAASPSSQSLPAPAQLSPSHRTLSPTRSDVSTRAPSRSSDAYVVGAAAQRLTYGSSSNVNTHGEVPASTPCCSNTGVAEAPLQTVWPTRAEGGDEEVEVVVTIDPGDYF